MQVFENKAAKKFPASQGTESKLFAFCALATVCQPLTKVFSFIPKGFSHERRCRLFACISLC
jgi:hypothetical protein